VIRPIRLGLVAVVALLALPAIVIAAPDGTADVRFGNPETGSPFPPPDHDRSFNAKDNIIPRTAVISADGSVTYTLEGGPHQVAVYEAGTAPEDIMLLGPGPWVNDPNGRLALSPPNFEPATSTWTTPAGTFSAPGRYLVLCNFLPHFAFANQYSWVIVK
jgi:hypothetical protein